MVALVKNVSNCRPTVSSQKRRACRCGRQRVLLGAEYRKYLKRRRVLPFSAGNLGQSARFESRTKHSTILIEGFCIFSSVPTGKCLYGTLKQATINFCNIPFNCRYSLSSNRPILQLANYGAVKRIAKLHSAFDIVMWRRSWLRHCAKDGRSRVQFPMGSLRFFIDLNLPAAPRPQGRPTQSLT